MIAMFASNAAEFPTHLNRILQRGAELDHAVEDCVRAILQDVKTNGDDALQRYTQMFDHVDLATVGLRIPQAQIDAAYDALPAPERLALENAAAKIRAFHARQVRQTWFDQDTHGNLTGQRFLPLEAVGIYVPGGKAAYPSSVLMNALPAKVAGVPRIAMVVPTPQGIWNPAVLAAAKIAGVDEVYRIGGAQAVAALAYGTATIPRVDKIVGPGNIYVATAKRMVFGTVDIDMIAGPSEILIVADDSANPRHLAIDLLSQAEHDEMASSILVTPSQALATAVAAAVEDELKRLPRASIARKSIDDYGAIITVPDINAACELSNQIAPEHLELAVNEPFAILHRIKNAGAIFMGHFTPEAVGDYIAGPNHVLPTGGTARFFGPLGLDDFVKRSSIIAYTPEGLAAVAQDVATLTAMEGLDAHGLSVSARIS